MKKLKEYKEDYYTFTGKVSEVNRSLAFSGIAIVWIFNKTNTNDLINIPSELSLPLFLFFITIALDLLQYLIGGLIWFFFYKYHENKGMDEEDELEAPNIFPLILHVLYFSKIIVNIIAFSILSKYLITFI
jgi:hypothetical protein